MLGFYVLCTLLPLHLSINRIADDCYPPFKYLTGTFHLGKVDFSILNDLP